MIILGHIAGMTAEYESNLHVPCCVPIVMEAAKESCKEAYLKKGRPDLYNENMVHYVTDINLRMQLVLTELLRENQLLFIRVNSMQNLYY